jgi:hypothetical protein
MKTAVYSWRVSPQKKAELEAESRREGTSMARLLDDITSGWLSARRNGNGHDDAAEQAAIRDRAAAAIGSVRGGDPTRSARAGTLVREIIHRKHVKEPNALARRFSRRAD